MALSADSRSARCVSVAARSRGGHGLGELGAQAIDLGLERPSVDLEERAGPGAPGCLPRTRRREISPETRGRTATDWTGSSRPVNSSHSVMSRATAGRGRDLWRGRGAAVRFDAGARRRRRWRRRRPARTARHGEGGKRAEGDAKDACRAGAREALHNPAEVRVRRPSQRHRIPSPGRAWSPSAERTRRGVGPNGGVPPAWRLAA